MCESCRKRFITLCIIREHSEYIQVTSIKVLNKLCSMLFGTKEHTVLSLWA